jgi:hypothetical protein
MAERYTTTINQVIGTYRRNKRERENKRNREIETSSKDDYPQRNVGYEK